MTLKSGLPLLKLRQVKPGVKNAQKINKRYIRSAAPVCVMVQIDVLSHSAELGLPGGGGREGGGCGGVTNYAVHIEE